MKSLPAVPEEFADAMEPPGNPTWRPMTMADLRTVPDLDALCQPHPWGPANFQGELLRGESGFSWVGELPETGPVAYICAWTVLDELHVGNIGVSPSWRRKGLARTLLARTHQWAKSRGANFAHLEVRAGNSAAIALYESIGYRRVGVRRAYYADNNEDALLLVADL
ncbi:MAG: ribosomal protein S18-alanine N-acetyltransferase [Fibrobacteria bacterium]|nr:ribosomal protein S18-alanine N-acetyltransferase [Fibrobacteria bacterium]